MSKKVDALFFRFRAIYGHKWASVFSDPTILGMAKKEWATVIDRMEDEDIAEGIEYCKRIYDWPPSIAEFIRAALNIDEDDIRRACFPRGTGTLTYKEADKVFERWRTHHLDQLIEKRLLPVPALLENDSQEKGEGISLGRPIN